MAPHHSGGLGCGNSNFYLHSETLFRRRNGYRKRFAGIRGPAPESAVCERTVAHQKLHDWELYTLNCVISNAGAWLKILYKVFAELFSKSDRNSLYVNIHHTNNIITETQGYYKIFFTNGIYFLKKIWYNVQ